MTKRKTISPAKKRKCLKCLLWKPFESFCLNKSCITGRSNICKECHCKRVKRDYARTGGFMCKKWHANNVERFNLTRLNWENSHKEQRLYYWRGYYAKKTILDPNVARNAR